LFAGTVKVQGFACCAITRQAIETIGYFDENFRPAYYEDMDHLARARRAGLIAAIDRRILVEHDRSRTLRSDPHLSAEASHFLKLNRDYYLRKWGGVPHKEVYDKPFDRPDLGLRISYKMRSAPYGPALDRSD
jgi:GT2 family glycosyltransferase